MPEEIDPISGNAIPPGGVAKEVRDNIPIMASENEYMLPADVVKYFGLDYIEKLVNKAKAGMEELQANGRIGGKGEDELPFSPEELVAHEQEMVAPAQEVPVEQAPHMAEGGFVSKIKLNPLFEQQQNSLPSWMWDRKQDQVRKQPSPVSSSSSAEDAVKTPTGFGQRMENWQTKDYIDYSKFQGGVGKELVDKFASGLFQPVGSVIKMATNRTNASAKSAIDDMLKSGLDRSGKTLSKEDKTSLQKARSDLDGVGKDRKSLISRIVGGLSGGEQKQKTTPVAKAVKIATPTKKSKDSLVKRK